jgi:TolB-like protein/Tfp pilus assembly protein PilF
MFDWPGASHYQGGVENHFRLTYTGGVAPLRQQTLSDRTGYFTTLPAGSTSTDRRRLDSWKEIASFFGRDERTVSRWEKDLGLPVHRLPGTKGRVFAYTDELSAWQSAPSHAEGSASAFESGQTVRSVSGSTVSGSESSQVAVIAEPEESAAIEPRPEAPVNSVAGRTTFGWKVAGVGLAILLGLAVLSLSVLYRSPEADSVAVLPFADSGGDADMDYLSDGFTESLIGNLTHVPQLKVRSRSAILRYKGKDVDLQKAGGDLGVTLLVSGRIAVQGDNLEVSAELTDVRENTEIWLQHYHGKSADILSLQQQIAGDIAGKLRAQLSPEEKRQVIRQGTENSDAYELYLKGRYAWNKRTAADLAAAISYFNQAIGKDPGYALAYSGLADAYSVLPRYGGPPTENYPRSNAAARRALELDPTLARAHAVLGGNEMQYDWDFAGGEAEFKKAWELDPNYATAHQWYAENIGMIGGRDREAIAEINRAQKLDPLSPIIAVEVGYVHNVVGRYDEGIAICRKIANENPKFAQAHFCLAYGYWAKRMYPQVIEERRTFAQLTGDPNELNYASALNEGFRSAGWNGALIKGIQARKTQRDRGYYSAFAIAALYADLGDKNQAFQWLNTACLERDGQLTALKTEFSLASLRSDPRFAELVGKVGLPR